MIDDDDDVSTARKLLQLLVKAERGRRGSIPCVIPSSFSSIPCLKIRIHNVSGHLIYTFSGNTSPLSTFDQLPAKFHDSPERLLC